MLSYRCDGDSHKPALVLLHGFLGSQADWDKMLPILRQHFYCVAIDLPGHGDNQDDNRQPILPIPGFDECVSLIQQTLASLNIAQYHLLGYSLGGRVALHLARQCPERLLSLTLESCHPGLATDSERLARKQQDQQWAEKLATMPMQDFLALWYHQALFATLTSRERAQLIAKRAHNRSSGLLNCYLATSLAHQGWLWDTPSLINASCHFIVGVDDTKFRALATHWQQTEAVSLHCIGSSGHNVHHAAPEAYSRLLIELLVGS